MVGRWVDTRPDPGTGFVAGDDCGQHIPAALFQHLPQGKGGGDGDDAQVGDGGVVHVVQIHHMPRHRVDGGGLFHGYFGEMGGKQGGLGEGRLYAVIRPPDFRLSLL